MFGVGILHEHLISDGFFDGSEHDLSIIDNYHTKDIREDAVDYYVGEFKDVGLHNLTVYFLYKGTYDKYEDELFELTKRIQGNITSDELKVFLTFFTKTPRKGESLNQMLQSYYSNEYSRGSYRNRAEKEINATLYFITRMKAECGIEVTYQAYDSINMRPPFHGRYWINSNCGYIVDGSLNTFSSARIFAQKMDEENYSIIKEMFNHKIRPACQKHQPIDGQRLLAINEFLCEYF